jgi:hypothetical protein
MSLAQIPFVALLLASAASASIHATVEANAPAGYGVFATFNATLQIIQQYLLTPPVASTTATGYAKTFIGDNHVIDDGAGGGACFENASLGVNGITSPHTTDFSIPITFGQLITVVETASISCSKSSTSGFGEDGALEYFAATPFLLYDANGNLIGPATLTTVPEPSATVLLLLIAFYSLRQHRRRGKSARYANVSTWPLHKLRSMKSGSPWRARTISFPRKFSAGEISLR